MTFIWTIIQYIYLATTPAQKLCARSDNSQFLAVFEMYPMVTIRSITTIPLLKKTSLVGRQMLYWRVSIASVFSYHRYYGYISSTATEKCERVFNLNMYLI